MNLYILSRDYKLLDFVLWFTVLFNSIKLKLLEYSNHLLKQERNRLLEGNTKTCKRSTTYINWCNLKNFTNNSISLYSTISKIVMTRTLNHWKIPMILNCWNLQKNIFLKSDLGNIISLPSNVCFQTIWIFQWFVVTGTK